MKRITRIFLVTYVAFSFAFMSNVYAQGYQLAIKPELQEAIESQIEKEEDNGYEDFKLLYVKDGGGKVRIVYSAVNTELNSSYIGTDKWLMGFTFSNNNNRWFYVGGRSKAYLSGKDFEDMKEWAQKASHW